MTKLFKKFIILFLTFSFTIVLVGCDTLSTTTTSSGITSTTSTDLPITTITGNIGIEVINITKTEYNLGTSFDYDSITVVLVKASGSTIPLSSSLYTMTGFDSSTPGEITINIGYLDYTASFSITIKEPSTNLDITLTYYEDAQDLVGEPLLLALRAIVNNGYAGHIYTDASIALQTTDEDPNNANNIILVYSGTSIVSTWDEGGSWNKEHVWPQSLLDEDAGNQVNMASDLHNLKPATPSINSARGNKYFDISTTVVSFEPRDEVKGDIARILFYMMTMYSVLELIDGTPLIHQMAMLSVLLEWNDFDPVDDFERNRNEKIFLYQNNRNPYIDYPEFVDLVWDNLD
ncbi:MAG: endonuclease [Firmicutes bacterium]|nr:endonuclease [Bacillota bacterium]